MKNGIWLKTREHAIIACNKRNKNNPKRKESVFEWKATQRDKSFFVGTNDEWISAGLTLLGKKIVGRKSI